MLYRIRDPNIRKLALVKNPASGHRWHLLKSAPDEGADLDALVDSLSYDEAAELVEQIDRQQQIMQRFDRLEAKLAKAEPAIRARRALGMLAKSSTASPEQRIADIVEHEAIRQRQERKLAEMRSLPDHPSGFYNKPTASAEQTADAVMRLKAADPRGSKPRYAM